jgi:glycosyltransferase XagB
VTVLEVLLICAALVLTADTLFSLWLMLYVWDDPARLKDRTGPETFVEPRVGFSALVPARREAPVIGDTIARLCRANYPSEMFEVIVICQADDGPTIAAVLDAIDVQGGRDVRLVMYDEEPFNKPHALQHGYAVAQHEVVCVFDAEDDVHPDIFSVVNSVMVREGSRVVQGGVQLMNLEDHWFSALNCLEYFLYFGSRMHFNAKIGMIPLGGNTIFVARDLIDRVGGWNTACLTEDADLGVRLSALGEPIRVVYDSRWVTREETPHSVGDFVRQRTRWHQGFLQVLAARRWRQIDGFKPKALAVATFGHPLQDALLGVFTVLMPLTIIFLNLPVLATLVLLLPLYALAMQMLAYLAALMMFCNVYAIRVPRKLFLVIPVAFLPYQLMLSISAARAVLRQLRGSREWEKTTHRGAHRTVAGGSLAEGPEPVRRPTSDDAVLQSLTHQARS